MPRRSKAIGPDPSVLETPPAAPAERKGTKTAAIKQALGTHPDLQPKDIAAMLQAEGWDISAHWSVWSSRIRNPKRQAGRKLGRTARKTARTRAAKPAAAAAPAASDESISLDSLKKAKELAAQLGGIKQAKEALAALSELLDG
jgi:hypothetical protein